MHAGSRSTQHQLQEHDQPGEWLTAHRHLDQEQWEGQGGTWGRVQELREGAELEGVRTRRCCTAPVL
jgi:hypothetical protein